MIMEYCMIEMIHKIPCLDCRHYAWTWNCATLDSEPRVAITEWPGLLNMPDMILSTHVKPYALITYIHPMSGRILKPIE